MHLELGFTYRCQYATNVPYYYCVYGHFALNTSGDELQTGFHYGDDCLLRMSINFTET
jgi:hypothetical protein